MVFVLSCETYTDNNLNNIQNPIIKKEIERLSKVLPKTEVITNLYGIVNNEDGLPLSGVIVTVGDKEQITDSEGFFQFIEVSLNKDYAVVKAKKSGYFEGIRTFKPTAESFNKITISMLDKGITMNLNAEVGGKIEFEKGSIILDFPENSLTDNKGKIYKGIAKIRARYINPQSNNFGEIMPGNLLGLTNNEFITGMISYGMLTVEITDDLGNLLEVSNNKEVDVDMPAIEGSPVEIPTWHFNEKYGLWVESGTATKVGNRYQFKANHFSSWNLDKPFNGADVNIQFDNQDGDPLPNLKINIFDINYNFLKTVYTDSEGKLDLLKAPQEMIFRINSECEDDILETSYTISGSSGKITIKDLESRVYKLTGKIENCEEILSNKYFTIIGENNILFKGKTRSDGTFEIFTLLCDNILQNIDYSLLATVYTSSLTLKQYNIIIKFSGKYQNKNLNLCSIQEIKNYLNPDLTYGTVSDIDGNIYATIKIGSQIWMAENLTTSKYNDGTEIPNVKPYEYWTNLTSGAWCYYSPKENQNAIYGKLYNWYAVSNGKLCPVGWHVPTEADWKELINYLGGDDVAGLKLKSSKLWFYSSTPGTNISGFSAIPGGERINTDLSFFNLGQVGKYWSSNNEMNNTFGVSRRMHNGSYKVQRSEESKTRGLSCRCIKD